MNFLEQLAAEWYEYYKGYFCRTNIKFGETGHGGHLGEMDVVAYHPITKEFIHIETSTDALPWLKKKIIFKKKFRTAEPHYRRVFLLPHKKMKQIAITGFSIPRTKPDFGKIKVVLIPKFIQEITNTLRNQDPTKKAIPESYPLLRAIQFSSFYSNKLSKKRKITP